MPGAQVCLTDGTFGPCDCATEAASDTGRGFTAPDAGTSAGDVGWAFDLGFTSGETCVDDCFFIVDNGRECCQTDPENPCANQDAGEVERMSCENRCASGAGAGTEAYAENQRHKALCQVRFGLDVVCASQWDDGCDVTCESYRDCMSYLP